MLESSVRPWGSYEVLQESAICKVKSISVDPGQRLSYQKHAFRAEHWFIVQGSAHVMINDELFERSAGESIGFPIQTWHRIANSGSNQLIFIEVQTGTSFEESDIERKEDDYGRTV